MLRPEALGEIPAETVRVARAAFPKGNLYLRMRDELGVLYEDADFASLFPTHGRPALPPPTSVRPSNSTRDKIKQNDSVRVAERSRSHLEQVAFYQGILPLVRSFPGIPQRGLRHSRSP